MTWIISADLGQVQDYTAIGAVRVTAAPPRHFLVGHLERMRGESYPRVVERIAALAADPQLRSAPLVLDQTGVGRPVVDLVRRALPGRAVYGLTVTGGGNASRGPVPCDVRVAKRLLVAGLQVGLSSGRLKVARELPLMPVLQNELANYRMKITPALNEQFEAGREGVNDDLVSCVGMAVWLGENLPDPVGDVRDWVLNDLPDEDEEKDQRPRLATLADDLPDVFADT